MSDKYMEREEWLHDKGVTEKDVIVDYLNHKEYVLLVVENGTAGDEDYEVEEERVYLPEELSNL